MSGIRGRKAMEASGDARAHKNKDKDENKNKNKIFLFMIRTFFSLDETNSAKKRNANV